MTEAFDVGRQTFLEPAELDENRIADVLGRLMKPGVDSADLYFQHAVTETWSLEDSMIKSGAHHIEHGVGVRAVAGDKQGLAYSDDLRMPALGDAAHTAGAIVRQGQEGAVQAFAPRIVKPLYAAVDPLKSWPTDKKLELLRRADAAARAADSRVIPVVCSLAGSYGTILEIGSASCKERVGEYV